MLKATHTEKVEEEKEITYAEIRGEEIRQEEERQDMTMFVDNPREDESKKKEPSMVINTID